MAKAEVLISSASAFCFTPLKRLAATRSAGQRSALVKCKLRRIRFKNQSGRCIRY